MYFHSGKQPFCLCKNIGPELTSAAGLRINLFITQTIPPLKKEQNIKFWSAYDTKENYPAFIGFNLKFAHFRNLQ